MKFTVQYPLTVRGYTPEFLGPQAMTRFARAAEESGFDALAVTDHPIPSDKWIRSGGHDGFDLTTALGFCAAVTDRIKLMTYAMVLPYRNPFLVAKAMATLDRLSQGRAVLAAGAGYLKSEFAAVGADFDERNELFDEAIEVMRGAWTQRGYRYEGRHFTSLAQTALPFPVQDGGVPVWIAGNARRAIERAATVGQGWAPLLIDREMARTVRTTAIPTVAALTRAIGRLRDLTEAAGRPRDAVEVQIEGRDSQVLLHRTSLDQHHDRLHEFDQAGVGWFVLDTPATTVDEAIDALHRYGDAVISRFR
ncbi:LLM class F420-dependent oxidoreductase [Nocardia jiangxiensis]|uniref:LLM class F420-dependent oxidoreductase n=1 Tax=Nocardia jiangxiensis TaxID=282685 RepID=A0ABW6SAJ6_9NOCA|nr:LLM class F420-dependent oxidoreductase [Nocardia jiangxiensis]